MRARIVALAALAFAACGKKDAPPPPSPPPPPIPEPAPPKIVDLLHFTPAIVAMSSKVDNPKDFPQHIVDGKLETAWNGRTGDLVGGWIAFRVPPEAKVKNIQLTSGFDKDGLFEKNVRLTRVRITRFGDLVKEATLDPDRRGMQTIEIDGLGGDYKMEVLAVARGTRADYKELCVSEIVVNGIPGSELYDAPRMPHVFVGSLTDDVLPPPRPGVPPFAPRAGVGPWASPEEFCAAQKKGAARPLFEKWGSGERYPGVIEPECSTSKLEVEKRALLPPFLDAVAFLAHEPEELVNGVLVKTDRGWWRLPWRLGRHDYDDPGCMHAGHQRRYELASSAEGAPKIWMRILDVESVWMQGEKMSSWTTWSDRLELCRVDETTKDVTCDASKEVAKARSEAGDPDSVLRKPPFAFEKTEQLLQ